jgi:hypothetical protein
MDKQELKSIQGFLTLVGAGLAGNDTGVSLPDRLAELSRIIQRLMNARLGGGTLKARVQMATLERRARRYRRDIEARLNEDRSAH